MCVCVWVKVGDEEDGGIDGGKNKKEDELGLIFVSKDEYPKRLC